jgi:carbonic anhydrase
MTEPFNKNDYGKHTQQLLATTAQWAEDKIRLDPEYFTKRARGQNPTYLWIGCSDSRVPESEVTGTEPGEIFVHRNIANMVVHTDLNMMSVLFYAVEKHGVQHVIVCGHYNCGGVEAAMSSTDLGIGNKWMRNIKEVYAKHQHTLEAIGDRQARARKFVELNVDEQVKDLAKTSIVQKAWLKRPLHLHGWVYDLHNGRLKDLRVTISGLGGVESIYQYKFDQ